MSGGVLKRRINSRSCPAYVMGFGNKKYVTVSFCPPAAALLGLWHTELL